MNYLGNDRLVSFKWSEISDSSRLALMRWRQMNEWMNNAWDKLKEPAQGIRHVQLNSTHFFLLNIQGKMDWIELSESFSQNFWVIWLTAWAKAKPNVLKLSNIVQRSIQMAMC